MARGTSSKLTATSAIALTGISALAVAGGAVSVPATASASSFTVLYTSKGGSDGFAAGPLVLGPNGSLYGVSYSGGVIKASGPCVYGCGDVFALTPKTKIVKGVPVTTYTKTILYKFSGSAGFGPRGQIVLAADGSIYGTLQNEYDFKHQTYGAGGFVYKLTPPASGKGAWKESTVHHFIDATEGSAPAGVIADSQGNLYGILQYAENASDGTPVFGRVYTLTQSGGGWTETTLHNFDRQYDFTPNIDLTMDATGALYGSSSNAGVDGVGRIFQVVPGPTVSYSVIHEFTGSPSTLGDAGGGVPYSGVVADANGVLYGTTFGGGSGIGPIGGGTAYSLTAAVAPASGWTFNVLYNFDYASESFPRAGLTVTPSGTLYGTTATANSETSYGAIFGLYPPAAGSATWTEANLFTMGAAADGGNPLYPMVADGAGNYYGSADFVIFKFVP